MILVFGKTGQVARELAALSPDAHFAGRDQADLSDPQTCHDLITRLRPKAVINAAAYTAVDRAEGEADLASRINADAPAAMATACVALGIPIVHISTDYVFDGAGDKPFAPDHPTAPLGVYGRTKLAGENGVRQSGATHAILRTSWVFSPHGTNFVRTMLRLGAERDVLRVVADQWGGPTPARAIADACLQIVSQLGTSPDKTGTYHFAGAPVTTWAGFAQAIMAEAGLDCRIDPIPTSDYPTPAQRPLNSRLDCFSLSAQFGISQPDWRVDLSACVKILQSANA